MTRTDDEIRKDLAGVESYGYHTNTGRAATRTLRLAADVPALLAALAAPVGRGDSQPDDDLLEAAWGLIANSHAWHDPSAATPGWREAAERWRARYHARIGAVVPQQDEPRPHICDVLGAKVCGYPECPGPAAGTPKDTDPLNPPCVRCGMSRFDCETGRELGDGRCCQQHHHPAARIRP